MKDEQFKQLLDAQTETNKLLKGVAEAFAKKPETETPPTKTEETKPEADKSAEKFVSQDDFKKLSEKIDGIATAFDEIKKAAAGATKPGEETGDARPDLL